MLLTSKLQPCPIPTMSKATVKTTPAQKVLLVLGSGLLMLVGVSRATRRPRDHNGQQLAYIYFESEPGRAPSLVSS